jgi:cytidylate kinase
LLLGCLILGIGVYLEVLADVVMLPGESFVRAVVVTFHTEFGTTKIAFDCSMAVIAGVLSFVFFGKLQGVREGTLVAALLVGFIARTLSRWLSFMPEKLFGTADNTSAATTEKDGKANVCIVIGRQYGSGGHDYGKHLADKLGYAFYDNEMIDMAAQTLGYDTKLVSAEEESMTNSLLYDLVNQMYLYDKDSKATKEAIFEAQANIMKELAAKGNCVIVGRCGDYILRNHPGMISLFLHAPETYRRERVAKTEQISKEEAAKKIAKTDRMRAENYHYFTKRQWGMGENYTLCMDTTLGEDCMDSMVMEVLENK